MGFYATFSGIKTSKHQQRVDSSAVFEFLLMQPNGFLRHDHILFSVSTEKVYNNEQTQHMSE